MWRSKKQPFRQELVDARLNIERQLEILRGAPQIKVTPSPDNRSIIGTLEEELREIDEALANLGPDDT